MICWEAFVEETFAIMEHSEVQLLTNLTGLFEGASLCLVSLNHTSGIADHIGSTE